MENFRSGFIGIVGRTNAGKSTLINQILDEKIAIVTNKPQTTRNIIRGIKTTDDTQYIFLDSPGFHKPRHKLGEVMLKQAYNVIKDADLIYYVVDASVKSGKGDQFTLSKLKNIKKPIILILNKIDKINQETLLEVINFWSQKFDFAEIIPISAKTNDNIERLLEISRPFLTDNMMYYPEDLVSDQEDNFFYTEIVREKLIQVLKEELPFSIAVVVENYEKVNKTHYIDILIAVERNSQKGIVIGKNGNVLKNVGILARKEIQEKIGGHVHLNLYVKVIKDWRNNLKKISGLGHFSE